MWPHGHHCCLGNGCCTKLMSVKLDREGSKSELIELNYQNVLHVKIRSWYALLTLSLLHTAY